MTEPENRRPLKSRGAGWAKGLAKRLAEAEVSPDVVSAGSVMFALLGAMCLLWSRSADGPARALLFLAAAVFIQLRLICNLLDGMVAVEHGKGGPYGPIWNELPDRVADVLLLVAAGYGASILTDLSGASALGWLAAVLAVLTAYVRELGRALGFPADFCGPMAKPQRMAVLTAACLVSMIEPLWGWGGHVMVIALMVIAIGAVATVIRRVRHLARRLRERDGDGED